MSLSGLFIVLAITYVGSCISKLLFYFSNVKTSAKINGMFVAIPFSSIRLSKYIERKSISTKISNKKALVIELLGALSFFIFTFSVLTLISNNFATPSESILIFVLNLYFLIAILYFAINDILRLKLPEKNVRLFLISVVIINVVIGLYRFIVYLTTGEQVLTNVSLGYLDNLIAGGLLVLILFICIRINPKSFGRIDLDLVLSLGLILGFQISIIAIIFISIIGAIISVLYCLRLRRFRDVIVPFAPAILLGYALAIGFGQQFLVFLSNL